MQTPSTISTMCRRWSMPTPPGRSTPTFRSSRSTIYDVFSSQIPVCSARRDEVGFMTDRLSRYVEGGYHVGIRSIGKYIPSRIVTNAELAGRLPTTDEWIKQNIGIETRYFT